MNERLADLADDARFLLRRAGRHIAKMRKQGIHRVAAEDVDRIASRVRRLGWRLRHNCAPNAVPVFIAGLQRSGTKMLVYGLRRCPEIEVYNESARSAAFKHFRLREDAVIRALTERSPHRCVAFKALWDSHRLLHLLDGLGTPRKGRAIWIYRSMEGRARSSVAQFGDDDLRVLAAVASGDGETTWLEAGLTPEQRRLVEGFDYRRMTPESAAALIWYLRNSLFFELGLHEREDVALASYDRFLRDPEGMMRAVCSFLGISYGARMIAGIAPRPAPMRDELDIDPSVRSLCTELERRLDAWLEAVRHAPASPLRREAAAAGRLA